MVKLSLTATVCVRALARAIRNTWKLNNLPHQQVKHSTRWKGGVGVACEGGIGVTGNSALGLRKSSSHSGIKTNLPNNQTGVD